jgi:hypothetical protein
MDSSVRLNISRAIYDFNDRNTKSGIYLDVAESTRIAKFSNFHYIKELPLRELKSRLFVEHRLSGIGIKGIDMKSILTEEYLLENLELALKLKSR